MGNRILHLSRHRLCARSPRYQLASKPGVAQIVQVLPQLWLKGLPARSQRQVGTSVQTPACVDLMGILKQTALARPDRERDRTREEDIGELKARGQGILERRASVSKPTTMVNT